MMAEQEITSATARVTNVRIAPRKLALLLI